MAKYPAAKAVDGIISDARQPLKQDFPQELDLLALRRLRGMLAA